MLLNETTFAVIDLEATGFLEMGGRVCEIGIVKTRRGKVLENWSQLINPQFINPKKFPISYQIHNIDLDMLENQPTFREIIPELERRLANCIPVFHNASGDYDFLRYEYQLCQKAFNLPQIMIDTMLLSRKFLKKGGLAELTTLLGIQHGQLHRALIDAQATSEVLSHLLIHLEQIGILSNRATLTDLLKIQPAIKFRKSFQVHFHRWQAISKVKLNPVPVVSVKPPSSQAKPNDLPASTNKTKLSVATTQATLLTAGSVNKSIAKIPVEEALVMTEKTRLTALQNFKKREYSVEALKEIKEFVDKKAVLSLERTFTDLQVQYQALYRVLQGEQAQQIIKEFAQELAKTVTTINQTGNVELLKKLRLGSPDKFSQLTLPELVKLADKQAVAKVQRVITDPHAQTTTLRWVLRGLNPTMAIKRTKMWQQKLLDFQSTQ